MRRLLFQHNKCTRSNTHAVSDCANAESSIAFEASPQTGRYCRARSRFTRVLHPVHASHLPFSSRSTGCVARCGSSRPRRTAQDPRAGSHALRSALPCSVHGPAAAQRHLRASDLSRGTREHGVVRQGLNRPAELNWHWPTSPLRSLPPAGQGSDQTSPRQGRSRRRTSSAHQGSGGSSSPDREGAGSFG